MKTSEIQELILAETGIKTSVRKLSGSMKNYLSFRCLFQGGDYPKFTHEWRTIFVKQFNTTPGFGNYHSDYSIEILNINISEYDPILYKKERKPKPIEEQKVKTWGSKYSQLRLDKATMRNAKKLRAGTTARYY